MRKAEVRAILVDGKAYEKKRDGSLVPLKSRTNWARVARMTDADIEVQTRGADDAPMTDEECASMMTCCFGSRRAGRAIRRASMRCCGGISRRSGRRGESAAATSK